MSVHNTLRRTVLACSAALAALGVQLALTAGPAVAFTGYPSVPNFVFGAPGSGNGQLSSPRGVAVNDESGDVYVIDQGNNRVEEFDAEGKYISQFNGAETPAGSFSAGHNVSSIAVDNSTDAAKGDVYITDPGHGVIDVFDSTGKYLSQITGTPSPFAALVGVAVDTFGNIWADGRFANGGEQDVYEFSDTGGLLGQFTTYSALERGLAVDSSDNVYVMMSGFGEVLKYSSTGTELAGWGEGDTAIAVDETTNNVFVDKSGSIEEFGSFGEPYGSPVEAFGAGSISASLGFAVNDKTGTVYASQSNGDTIAVFKLGVYPGVSTGGAETMRGGAKLEGEVDPEGDEVTSCQFEYGTTTSYGHTAPCSPAPGSGSSAVAVTAEAAHLEGQTTYHYRLVAGNANGVEGGSDGTFTTPATVRMLGEPPTEVEATSATLRGAFLTEGLDTHDWFEYGPAYGTQTPHVDAGAGEGFVLADARIAGLEPNTIYQYRFAAENEFGVAHAEGETFTTLALPPLVVKELPATTITRVTATISGAVNPEKSATTYRILYGETSSYGQHTVEFQAGEGLGEVPFSVGLEALEPAQTYHYAVQATNQAGTVTGPDETFATGAPTPPGVTTGGASRVTLTTATVAGTIETRELSTSYVLELGTSSEYGTSIPGEAGEGSEPVQVTVPLQYLAPGTTYHYRFVAINSDGKVYGADETFTTPAYSAPIVLPSTLPLIATPAIAFPTETEPTQKKATKKKHRKGKGRSHGKRAKPGRSHKHG
jgi:NHL repeat-containing protein